MKRMVQAFELIFDFFNAFNKEASRRLDKKVKNDGYLRTTGCCIVQPIIVDEEERWLHFEIRYNYIERKVEVKAPTYDESSSESYKVLKETIDFFNRFEV